MDTDDLSEDAYNAVIVESERFHRDLTLQFGLLAEDCVDEDEFLTKCKQLIFELRGIKKYELDDIFYEDVPTLSDLRDALDRVMQNIEKVMSVPVKKRRFDSW